MLVAAAAAAKSTDAQDGWFLPRALHSYGSPAVCHFYASGVSSSFFGHGALRQIAGTVLLGLSAVLD